LFRKLPPALISVEGRPAGAAGGCACCAAAPAIMTTRPDATS